MLLLEPIKTRIVDFFRQGSARHDLRFLWLGGVIGILASIASIAFREFIHLITRLCFGAYVPPGSDPDQPFWDMISGAPLWLLFLVPIVAGVLVPWIGEKLPDAKGHGVPEIMNAVATNRGIMRIRMTVAKFVTSAISIGSGFSVGREGPSALIGAGIGSMIGQWLKFPINNMKMVVGCGAAAGIAATFNAPLAGTLFAVELIVGNYNIRHLTAIFMAAMTATVISHHYYGDTHELFSSLKYELLHPLEIVSYAGLGVAAALIGVLFVKTLYFAEDRADGLKWPYYAKGVLNGAGIGLMLWLAPHISGPATWDAITQAVKTSMNTNMAMLFFGFAVLKIVMTSWSIALGASGGIFAPSLVIGSYLGAAYGFAVSKILPYHAHTPASYALVGMGAVVAAVTQAPLTAITIIFEMTHNMSILLPLVVAGGISVGVYNHYMSGSIYTIKLQRKGLNFEWGRETGVLENVRIEKVAAPEDEFFNPTASYDDMIRHFSQSSRSTLPVVDNGVVVGLVSFWEIRSLSAEKTDTTASGLMRTQFDFVTPEQNLYDAFTLISAGDYEYLPVVSSARSMRLVGRLSRQRILQTYKNQLTMRGIIN
jgi:CIC family chloride channel protein